MEKHSGDTDKPKEVKLTSSIEQVVWTNKSGAPGGKVGLQITTQLVGNNSEVSVQISDKSGSTFDTIKKKMFGGKCWVQVTVPEKAKDELFAEVKLSKLSLTKKSNGLVVYPPIEIKNLKWDRDEVHRGDIVRITAEVSNVYDGAEAEVQIWEHDSDNAHDFIASIPVNIKSKKIETEWEFQYVDDTDDIPTEEETENGYHWPEYFFRVVIGGKSEDSKVMKFNDWVDFDFNLDNETSLTNNKINLITADGKKREETVDDQGKLHLENLPPGPIQILIDEAETDKSRSTNVTNRNQSVLEADKQYEADLKALKHLESDINLYPILTEVIKELNAIVHKIDYWNNVPTSGNVICFYSETGKRYHVNYQYGDLGNLIHELTHVSVSETFDQDFVNYPNKDADNVPAREFDQRGRCKNEFERQTKFMNSDWNNVIINKFESLIKLTKAEKKLEDNKKKEILDKLTYGMRNPHTECDTVLNQILMWLYQWNWHATEKRSTTANTGYFFRIFGRKKTSLLMEFEKAVEEAFNRRKLQN